MSGAASSVGPTIPVDPRVVPGPARRRWAAGGADLTIAFALISSAIAVPLLSSQNAQLRKDVAAQAGTASAARGLQLTLERNIRLSALDGVALPEPIAAAVRSAARGALGPGGAGLVAMVYSPMVCQRSLHNGLKSLRERRALVARGLTPLAVVGEHSTHDRERALVLRADGDLPFPVAFVPATALIGAVATRSDSTADEEPVYLYLDRNLVVRSAFHADQHRPELLDAWLDGVR